MRKVALLVVLVSLVQLVGCASPTYTPPLTERVIMGVVPPIVPQSKYDKEMYTVARTYPEQWEVFRHTNTMNRRQLREEWYSFWLLDSPARHSMYPIRSTRP